MIARISTNIRRSSCLAMIAFAAALALAASALHAEGTHRVVKVLDQVGFRPTIGAQVPRDIEFVDHRGRRVTLDKYLGERPVILHLVYFGCPMLCNMATDGLLRGLEELKLDVGRDFSVVTVSFDPREGTKLASTAREAMLKRYGRPGAESGWHVLTGSQASIARLTSAVGFRYAFDSESGQYAHAAGLVVLDAEGKIARYISGINFPARDLRLALVEGSQGELGTRSDQVLLLCYMYDPTTGRYGLAILRLIQFAGISTTVALVSTIVVLLRRERAARTGGGETL